MRVIRYEDVLKKAATDKERRKLLIDGLAHVGRFVAGSEHEDDCEVKDGPGHACNCGKVLSSEQVAAAITELRK